MIVKASDELREAFYGVPEEQEAIREENSKIIVMSKDGYPQQYFPIKKPKLDSFLPSISEEARETIPQWFVEALMEGTFITIPKEDFVSLHEDVLEHLEVISR